VRYLDESNENIFSYLGTFATSSASGSDQTAVPTLTGRPLPNNIMTASFSTDNASLLYFDTSSEGSEAYIESVSTGARAQVWSSPLRQLTARWGAKNSIVVYTNPSLDAPGAVWLLDPNTWRARLLLADQRALAAQISPLGDRLLYSMQEGEGNIYSLRVLDIETNNITMLPLPTLAEKCVWQAGGSQYVYCAVPKNMQTKEYLTEWYMGGLPSNDVLWRFNVNTGAAKRIIDPTEEAGSELDMIDLAIDPTNTYLTFRTKQEESLWAVHLPREVVASSSSSVAGE
jgi:hypothetical protein